MREDLAGKETANPGLNKTWLQGLYREPITMTSLTRLLRAMTPDSAEEHSCGVPEGPSPAARGECLVKLPGPGWLPAVPKHPHI